MRAAHRAPKVIPPWAVLLRRMRSPGGTKCAVRRSGMTSAVYVATARMSSAALSAALPQRVELGMLLAASCFGSTSLGRSSRRPCVEACRSSTPSTQRGSASRFRFPVALLSPVACRLSTLKSHTSSSSPSRQPILDSRFALHPQLGRGQRAKLRASLTASPSASPP